MVAHDHGSTEPLALNEKEIERYSRQILMKDIGTEGQKKILAAKVTVVGAGGLGCPALQVLAGAGVGHIKVIDDDLVSLSNLPRQILHTTDNINKLKVRSVAEKIWAMNPAVQVEPIKERITRESAMNLLSGSDYVLECSDNLATKFLVNDVCVHLGIPFTIAGVVLFGGQVISVDPGQTACYRCVFGNPLESDPNMSCAGAGILATASITGGTIQANEALKAILGLKGRLLNRLLAFDLSQYSFLPAKLAKNPNCPVCSQPNHPYYLTASYEPDKPQDACSAPIRK